MSYLSAMVAIFPGPSTKITVGHEFSASFFDERPNMAAGVGNFP